MLGGAQPDRDRDRCDAVAPLSLAAGSFADLWPRVRAGSQGTPYAVGWCRASFMNGGIHPSLGWASAHPEHACFR